MRTELIQEFQLLQQSLANKFAGELADKFLSSVDAVNEKVVNSIAKRGRMLMLLEKRFNFSRIKKLRKRFFKS